MDEAPSSPKHSSGASRGRFRGCAGGKSLGRDPNERSLRLLCYRNPASVGLERGLQQINPLCFLSSSLPSSQLPPITCPMGFSIWVWFCAAPQEDTPRSLDKLPGHGSQQRENQGGREQRGWFCTPKPTPSPSSWEAHEKFQQNHAPDAGAKPSPVHLWLQGAPGTFGGSIPTCGCPHSPARAGAATSTTPPRAESEPETFSRPNSQGEKCAFFFFHPLKASLPRLW